VETVCHGRAAAVKEIDGIEPRHLAFHVLAADGSHSWKFVYTSSFISHVTAVKKKEKLCIKGK
jgi:hypothetical protein